MNIKHTFRVMPLLLMLGAVLMGGLASCSEGTTEYDPYHDWQSRNAVWFQEIADSARTAISVAKAQYGKDWEEHCDWRMICSLMRNGSPVAPVTDSIVVHIQHRGVGTTSPAFTDTVRIAYRGWMMPTMQYENSQTELTQVQNIFAQTYYGEFNVHTAAPAVDKVSIYTEGFATALQYMCEGDDWWVYIPCTLAYNAQSVGIAPGYSTLKFHIHLFDWFESGTGVEPWH